MKPRIVIVGGGGHARVILDILPDQFEVAGFTSTQAEDKTSYMFACPRLGTDDVLAKLHASGIGHAFVAIGRNSLRKAATTMLQDLGFALVTAISAHAVISRHAMLGDGVAIMPGAVVNIGTQIGDGAIINTNASVDHDCLIGAFAHVAPGVAIAGSVKIGEEVLIGVGARVIPGVKIGNRSVVGAGAVVIQDVPPDVLVAGVPAVFKKSL